MSSTDSTDSTAQARATEHAVRTYVEGWRDGDLDAVRSVLADDVTFTGPMATVEGIEDCLAGLAGMPSMMTDVVVHHRFVDGADAVTWLDLRTTVAPPTPTANWSHVVDGRITTIRVTFDPRAILAGASG